MNLMAWELRRIVASLVIGIAVTIIALVLVFTIPMSRDMLETAKLVASLALPVLWIIILFENIAADKEQLPFIAGLPRPPGRIFLVRAGLRLLILSVVTLALWLMLDFTRTWTISLTHSYNRESMQWSNLLGMMLPAIGLILLLGTSRLRPECGWQMTVVLIAGGLSQALALTFYAALTNWHGLFLCGLQAFLLFGVWSREIWNAAVLNRRMRWSVALLMLLPLLQYGATFAYWNLRHIPALKSAQAQGVILIPAEWGNMVWQARRQNDTQVIREILDQILEKIDYRPDSRPVFRNYDYGLNAAFERYLRGEMETCRKNGDREQFAAILRKKWFLTGFDSWRINGTVPKTADEIEFMSRLLEDAEKWEMDCRLLLQPFGRARFWPYRNNVADLFSAWAHSGPGLFRIFGRIIAQPLWEKSYVHTLEGAAESLRRLRRGDTLRHVNRDRRLQGFIEGWNKNMVRFSLAVYRTHLHMLEYGEAPDELSPEFRQFRYRKTANGFELGYNSESYRYPKEKKQ